MIKVELTGSIPLACDLCGKVKPNSKYTIAENGADVMMEHEDVIYGLNIKGFLCPGCSSAWRNIVSAFWGVDIENGLREMIAKGKQEESDEQKADRL